MRLTWFERAEMELEQELADGLISQSEFNAGIRDISAALREEAEDAGRAAYNDAMRYGDAS